MEKLGILFTMGALAITGTILYFLTNDYVEQKNAIMGQEYRKEHGGFSFEQCIKNKNLIKPIEWLKQKNSGIKPDEYEKEIKYVKHLENSVGLVSARGL